MLCMRKIITQNIVFAIDTVNAIVYFDCAGSTVLSNLYHTTLGQSFDQLREDTRKQIIAKSLDNDLHFVSPCFKGARRRGVTDPQALSPRMPEVEPLALPLRLYIIPTN